MDPASLINALKLVHDLEDRTKWSIEVINRVWLYQEYGFTMKGLPPRRVAERMLIWAIDKGFIEMLKGDQEFIISGKRKYKKFRFRDTSKVYRGTGEYKLMQVDDYMRMKDRSHEILTSEDYMKGDEVTRADKEMDKIMWKIASTIVENSQENNRRLFLTTAYHNVMADKEFMKERELYYLRKHGLR